MNKRYYKTVENKSPQSQVIFIYSTLGPSLPGYDDTFLSQSLNYYNNYF